MKARLTRELSLPDHTGALFTKDIEIDFVPQVGFAISDLATLTSEVTGVLLEIEGAGATLIVQLQDEKATSQEQLLSRVKTYIENGWVERKS